MPMVICAMSVLMMFVSSDEPIIQSLQGTYLESWFYYENSIVFGMATGVFAGIVVWFFVVYIPEQRKRSILKLNMIYSYRRFKENILYIFLIATNEQNSESAEELCDPQKFEDFFQGEKWYKVHNFLNAREDYFRDLLAEIELLSREALYVRNNYNIPDESVHKFLGNLSNLSHDHENRNPHCDYDHKKTLMRFLWSIFGQWDIVNGPYEEDPIQRMIDKM